TRRRDAEVSIPTRVCPNPTARLTRVMLPRQREMPSHPASASERCPRLDPRCGTLTISMSTAIKALQSNEICLPRKRQSLDQVLSARQIDAAIC
ncbi:MAG TPA: hypothetical protein PKH05_17585, partial [Nitrospira sp.]|nr:hypothetical protein [Nitrospira sp.]